MVLDGPIGGASGPKALTSGSRLPVGSDRLDTKAPLTWKDRACLGSCSGQFERHFPGEEYRAPSQDHCARRWPGTGVVHGPGSRCPSRIARRSSPNSPTGSRPSSAPSTPATLPTRSEPAGRTTRKPGGSWPSCASSGRPPTWEADGLQRKLALTQAPHDAGADYLQRQARGTACAGELTQKITVPEVLTMSDATC